MDGDVVRDRTRIIYNGAAILTLVIDKAGNMIGEPKLTTHALMEEGEATDKLKILADQIDGVLSVLELNELLDDNIVAEAARVAVRRSFKESHGKRPLVTIHVIRV